MIEIFYTLPGNYFLEHTDKNYMIGNYFDTVLHVNRYKINAIPYTNSNDLIEQTTYIYIHWFSPFNT